ncbi:hypothetical protein ACFSQ3_01895 [Sphingobacterium corticis]|uniref:Uncharacterized protein n=1 Tax=Sphingobacterium corticis TaxID=1812823 RepID=A0ABW5NGL2_9SPHI
MASENFYGQPTLDTIPLYRDTIGIESVEINHEVLTPEEKYERNKREFRSIYFNGDNKNIITAIGIIPPGIAVNINKLYNHFAKSGKQARRFQKVLADDFKLDKVNQTWYPLTQKLTKLDGQQLEDFRRYYHPDFEWWAAAEEYEQLDYIFKRLKNYQDSSVHIRAYLALPKQ